MDPNSHRFIASAAEFGNGKGRLYFAVSKSSNPLSSLDWHKYRLDRSGTHQGASFPGVATYPDYAKVGVDGEAIYVTSAHFAKDRNTTLNFSHTEIFALEKAPLLSGGPLNVVYDEPVITDSYSEWLAFWIQPATGQRKQQWRTFAGAFQLATPPAANPLHSGDLDGSSANAGKNWKATVTVTIHDGNHSAVSGATVSIQWTGGFGGFATGITDWNGRCTFTSGNIAKTSSSATLTVLNVTHPVLTYQASANHDPDGDSNGTAITVNSP